MTFPWDELNDPISVATRQPFRVVTHEGVSGGSINRAAAISGTDGRRYFVKLNDVAKLTMFEAEAQGLHELAQARALRVPAVICSGIHDNQAFLVLEYLPLVQGGERAQEQLGFQLARQHRTVNAQFGWHIENTIGSTPQLNDACNDWVTFYRERRLIYQLHLCKTRSVRAAGEALLEQLPVFFETYQPAASLLHGDLWGGNTGALSDGTPVVFDPAVYFGDREADLAMTELFGGFSARFYAAYREAWPLDAGYRTRKTLYNLYHVLNHYNIFGGGYGMQAERMMHQLLSETR